MATYTIGDIHGCLAAFLQCLDLCKFDKKKDTLISLGDVADGWHMVPECVAELMEIPNLIAVKGNHDWWLEEWMVTGVCKPVHYEQGGLASIAAYNKKAPHVKNDHYENFFRKQVDYYLDGQNRLFVHGGVKWQKDLDDQSRVDMYWDRHMYAVALQWEAFALTHPTHPKNWFKPFKEVFIGHTSTLYQTDYRFPQQTEPMSVVNLHNLDTGAGFNGKLTIMNVDTKEYWQSDLVTELYPTEYNQRLAKWKEDENKKKIKWGSK